ncbi:MAG: hypothetical protein N2Z76_10145 [Treponemataceae bacterium]|nr:hypothetical protein [Treponemataceae bacterium]
MSKNSIKERLGVVGWLVGVMILLVVSHPWAIEVQLDFSSSLGYRKENIEYLLKSSETDGSNAIGGLDTMLTAGGKLPDGTSGAIEFVVTGSLSAEKNLNLTVGEVYGTISPTNLVFFTLGRIRKKFGAAYFTNVSNRISPTIRTAKGITQEAVPLACLDVMVAEGFSISSLLWFPDELCWDEVCYAFSSHFCQGNTDGRILVYWEKSRWFSAGFNFSYGAGWFLFYGEGVWKQCSDQLYYENNLVFRKEYGLLTGAVGCTMFWDNLTIGIEWWGREEGYTKREQETVYELIKKVKEGSISPTPTETTFVHNLSYTPFEWGRYYSGCWLQFQRPFGLSGIVFSGYGVLGLEGFCWQLGVQCSYWLNEYSSLWCNGAWYDGEDTSEFKRIISEKFRCEIGIKVSL